MWIVWLIIVVGALTVLQMQFFHTVGLRRVNYRRYWSRENCYEGERAELIEVLENRKVVPIPWLRVESKISPNLRFKASGELDVLHDQFHRSSFFLGGHKRLTRRHNMLCLKRGWYVLHYAALTTGDLFGILRRSKDSYGDAELYVYPRPLEQDESLSTLKWQGDVAMRRWIMPDPILVSGIRDYRPGDQVRDIHWRATARTGKMQVRVHDYTVSPNILVALNVQIREDLWGAMEPEQVETIEKGVRISAHLLTWACENGMDSGFVCNGQLIDQRDEAVTIDNSAASPSHLDHMLKALSKLEIVRVLNFYTMLDHMIEQQYSGYDIAVVTAYRSDVLEERANALREMGNTVDFIAIHDGLEVQDDQTA